MTHNSHIAFYLPSLRGGGAERVIVRLANEFVERGHDVDIVLVSRTGEHLSAVDPRVRIVDLDTRRFLAAVPSLVRYLRTERPDTLLATIDSANVTAIVATRLARVETRVVIRISNMMSAKEAGERKLKHRLVHRTAEMVYPHADHVIGVSEGVSNDVSETFGVPSELVSTIYNPVVDEEFLGARTEPVDHPWFPEVGRDGGPWPANTRAPVILGVGELTPQKDFGTLIEAFSMVDIDPGPNPLLVILGEGGQRESLEALAHDLGIADRVQLPGFVDNPYAYMARCDAFALSSRWEGCPNVLIEAMGCGAPLVSTDCPSGPNELLRAGELGTLVPVDDPEALAAALEHTLTADHDPEPLYQHAQRFTVESIANAYLDVLTPEGTNHE